MAKDAHAELERIEKALLEEEDRANAPTAAFHIPEALDAYNSDHTDVSPQQLSDQLLDRKKHSLTGLSVIVFLLTLAILGAIGWFLLRRWGYFA